MEVSIKLVEVSEREHEGRKFNVYKVLAKGGKKMDCRFVRTCENVPTQPCVMICNEDDVNVDTTRMYPTLWVKHVIRTEELVRKSNFGTYFD